MDSFLLPAKSGAYGGGGGGSDIEFEGIMSSNFTDADKHVAAILLQLPRLVFESDSLFIWGGKKKKRKTRKRRLGVGDNINKDPETTDISAGATLTPEEPSTSKQWPDSSSPDTPLISNFSPVKPDPKTSPTKQNPAKRRKEDYLMLINQLEKERESLKTEIVNVRHKMNQAMTTNTLLKRKTELILSQEREKIAKLGEVNTDLTLGRQWTLPSTSRALSSSSTTDSASSATDGRQSRGGFGTMEQQQPLVLNRTVVVADNGRSFPAEMMRSLLVKLNVGPRQLPDLNDPADEWHVSRHPQPLDHYLDKKAMATLARQNRCRIYKAKTSLATRKI